MNIVRGRRYYKKDEVVIMYVVLKVKEIVDLGLWEEFCDLKGYGVHAVSEGLDLNLDFYFDEEEIKKLNLLKRLGI